MWKVSLFMVNKYFIVVHHPGASFALFNCESDLRESMKLVILRVLFYRGLYRKKNKRATIRSLTELIIVE